mmetsp:Transcript_8845/g.21832  ORF Transcript_8845/g.21832 Transcript_8845/m.21832 type:complete len:310 (+) Transcript_8845:193-1122(+)
MNNLRIASFLLVQLLVLANNCMAKKTSDNDNLLARMLLNHFSSLSSSNHAGFLRKLAESPMKAEFGPGASWDCSAESNRATDFDSCTLSEASKTVQQCYWCPLGSSQGICLRAGQASVINDLENDHLLHLKCYSDSDEVIDQEATAFWDEAMACLPHGRDTCGGGHDGHECTYCTVGDPAMGLCLSKSLWANMVVAQTLEYFEADVSETDQIRLDQVIHCAEDTSSEEEEVGIWNNPCEMPAPIEDDKAEADCFTKEGCTIAPNIFPGFLGSASGIHCVSTAQEQATSWAMGVLTDMGWIKEMYPHQVN